MSLKEYLREHCSLRPVYRLGDIVSKPGGRYYGELPVTTDLSGSPIGFPLIVVHGAKPGPVLLINGGVHGDEYDGMEAIRRTANELDPEQLSGILVAMPCMNTPAFEAAARKSSIDHLDLNRVFPGKSDGYITQRLAAAFVEDVVPHIDLHVDLHTGGGYGEIVPLVIVQKGFEDLALELGLAAGSEIVWKGGSWGGTARSASLAAGKPAITIEGGGGGYLESNVVRYGGVIQNIMRALDMVDGEPRIYDRYTAVTGTFWYSDVGGFYRALSSPGQRVSKGEAIAEIVDHHGRARQTLTAPEDGMVLWVRRRLATRPGDETVIFGPVEGVIEP